MICSPPQLFPYTSPYLYPLTNTFMTASGYMTAAVAVNRYLDIRLGCEVSTQGTHIPQVVPYAKGQLYKFLTVKSSLFQTFNHSTIKGIYLMKNQGKMALCLESILILKKNISLMDLFCNQSQVWFQKGFIQWVDHKFYGHFLV